MLTLMDLWMPILVSAAFVFVASSIFHMVIQLHKNDFKKLPGEEGILSAMRSGRVAPGCYVFPCPDDCKQMCTPEMIEKYKQGPVGFITVVPSGPPAMGKNLLMWFIYCAVIGSFAGYAAMLGLDRGAAYMDVFRITGTVAMAAYALGELSDSIWKGRSWRITLKFVFEGVIYGLVTAGAFGWLWPAAAAGT